jgi:DNA-binding transcriptional MerR regulator/methylmalonyl-CoA mutase cobalamin-binding subunit
MKSSKARETAARYPIRAVSRLTGIGIDTLRAWERRYGAVTPTRDDRGRIYSDADVARLRLLHQAVSLGHAIGRLAPLSDDQLRRLAAAEAPPTVSPSAPSRAAVDTSLFSAALLKFDGAAIDQEFSRLAAMLPPLELVRDVLLPTLREVGDTWNIRRGGIAHEHLTSAALRHLLGAFLRLYARRDPSIRLLFATPSGDRHEIGILAAAMLAASQGLAVIYLGPDLPAREIVEAVRAADADVLVLGLTLTGNGKPRERELRHLLRSLSPRVELWAGGPGTAPYGRLLSTRAITLSDFDAYVEQLARLGRKLSSSS